MDNKKKILIGVGVLAAVGLAYYLWKKDKAEDKSEKTGGEKKPEEKANALGRVNRFAPVVSPKISPLGTVSRGTVGTFGGGIVSKTIGLPDSSHGNKCYCGKDDSTPAKDVWNFACCDKATNKVVTITPVLDTLTKNNDLGTVSSLKVSPVISPLGNVGAISKTVVGV